MSAPEILPYEGVLVDGLSQGVAIMESWEAALSKDPVDLIKVEVYQMERHRVLFLLRSYLRMRIQKIEAHVLHYSANPELYQRLSEAEQQFADGYVDTMEGHFENAVLSKMPSKYESLMKQSETSDANDMIPTPRLDKFICCRSKCDIGTVLLSEDGRESIDIYRKDLYILCYQPVSNLLMVNKVELI
eukprot:TRINITY_DN6608_c0_g1_i1.p1 TRINITY_DN6608_c0_g1~~TRINITY_DN6608_c0_g1_i1.p1  ORF type:complete len:212 (-),score=27.06 TRINITY_DN6608_c0_g1_i1:326-889(-)